MKHELPDNVAAEFIIDDDDPVSFFYRSNVYYMHGELNVYLASSKFSHFTIKYGQWYFTIIC